MSGLSACCASGTLATGTPAGKEINIGGVTTYVATPSQPSTKAIVIASDIFGARFTNTRLIADALAKEGFLVVIPDMFGGVAVDPSVMETMVCLALGDRQESTWWLWATRPLRTAGRVAHVIANMLPFAMKHFPPAKKVPIFEAVASDLKSDHGIKSIGVIGYCYGAVPALKLACTDTIDAFAVAHGMIKVPDDLTPLKKPGLVVCADNDDQFPEKMRKQAEEVLSKRTDVPFTVKFYPGTFHGFAIRGDDKDPKIAEAKTDALAQMTSWFKTHLKA